MRTTLTIDDDVLEAVHEQARAQKRTAGDVLSELARQALTTRDIPDVDELPRRHGFPILPSRGGTVTNDMVNRIRDEIDY